jgi:hypothetical protein
MATKTKSRRVAAQTISEIPSDTVLPLPRTTEERIVHIRALGQRIDKHIRYMCSSGSLTGTSLEGRDRAVTVFYERLVTLEKQLGKIQEDLQLG